MAHDEQRCLEAQSSSGNILFLKITLEREGLTCTHQQQRDLRWVLL